MAERPGDAGAAAGGLVVSLSLFAGADSLLLASSVDAVAGASAFSADEDEAVSGSGAVPPQATSANAKATDVERNRSLMLRSYTGFRVVNRLGARAVTDWLVTEIERRGSDRPLEAEL